MLLHVLRMALRPCDRHDEIRTELSDRRPALRDRRAGAARPHQRAGGHDRPPGPCAAARTRHLERAARVARPAASPRSATSRSPNACASKRRCALRFDQLEADAGRVGNGARLFSRIAWVLPGLDALARAAPAHRCAGARPGRVDRRLRQADRRPAGGRVRGRRRRHRPGDLAPAGGDVQFHAGQGVRRPGARLRRRGLRLGPQRQRAPAAVAASDRIAGALLPGLRRVLGRGLVELWRASQSPDAVGRAGAAAPHRLRGACRRGRSMPI